MKLLSLFAGAFVAVAVVGAHSNDRLYGQNSQETLHQFENKFYDHKQTQHWDQTKYNEQLLEGNNKNWYNRGLNFNNDVEYYHSNFHNQAYGQQRLHQQNTNTWSHQNSGFNSDLSSGLMSSESNSYEEYIQGSKVNQNDAAFIVGNTCAKKMVKFYSIVENYVSNNGLIQNRWSNEPVQVPQVTVPLPNHQFLNMNENKVDGLNQGTIKSIKLNTEYNNVEVDYHFYELLVNGNLKTNNGQKEGFQVKMENTDVCVSTELYNKNLKTVATFNEKLDMSLENSSLMEKEQLINENVKSTYLRDLKRTIERKVYENTYNGLVECMRQESQKEFYISPEVITNMEILNKKTGFKVSLTNGHYKDESKTYANKISFVTVRPTQSGNGYRVKVNIVLAKQPSWVSDIIAQKGEQQYTFRNVQFQANEIVATATMESVYQHMGGRQFVVVDVDVKFNGLRFNVPSDQIFATEIEQNLRYMIESNVSVVLKEQLNQEYQICKQNPEQCNLCYRSNQSRTAL